jgi:hypothetical protein
LELFETDGDEKIPKVMYLAMIRPHPRFLKNQRNRRRGIIDNPFKSVYF